MFKHRFVLPLIALIVLTFGSFSLSAQDYKPEPVSPDFYAVTFYADWCASCKILEPNIEKARLDGALDTEKVLFVKLDLTNKETIHQSKMQATAMGLWPVLEANGAKTGAMVLVNAETKEQLVKFSRLNTADEIKDEIKANL